VAVLIATVFARLSRRLIGQMLARRPRQPTIGETELDTDISLCNTCNVYSLITKDPPRSVNLFLRMDWRP
jgi:hypothetical protein